MNLNYFFIIFMFDFNQNQILSRYQPAKNSQRQIGITNKAALFSNPLGPIIARPGTAEKI